MFGLSMLDVLIGLVTIYLSFGLACTAIVEAITTWGSVRSKNLEAALHELMAGGLTEQQQFVDAFFDHPIIQSLSKGKNGRPSYIPKELVSKVVQALLTAQHTTENLSAAIDAMPDGGGENRIKTILKSCMTNAETSAEDFRAAVEMHFDASIARASGWFKRYAQNVTMTVAMVLVFAANIDTLKIASSLSTDPGVRLELVKVAQQQLSEAAGDAVPGNVDNTSDALALAQDKTRQAAASVASARQNVEAAGLSFGWDGQSFPKGFGLLEKLVGLLISGFAISLGAPFWFDILKTFMNVRSSIAQPTSGSK